MPITVKTLTALITVKRTANKLVFCFRAIIKINSSYFCMHYLSKINVVLQIDKSVFKFQTRHHKKFKKTKIRNFFF